MSNTKFMVVTFCGGGVPYVTEFSNDTKKILLGIYLLSKPFIRK